MKQFKSLLSVLVIVMVLTECISAKESPGIKWREFDQAVELAALQGKKVLLYFRSDNCGYCREMEKKTLVDPLVVDYVDKNFIPVKIDTLKNPEAARKYRIFAVPNTYFLTPDGRPISNLPGFVPADLMLKILKYLDTDSYKTMTFSEFAGSR